VDKDGNSYPTVVIGDLVWMAKNLNQETEKSLCYDRKPENCEKYGRLYVWKDAMWACPAGWRLPNKKEFESLIDMGIIEGKNYSAKKLKTKTGWTSDNGNDGNGWDDFGFAALPAGAFSYTEKKGAIFRGIDNSTAFWSSSLKGDRVYFMHLDRSNEADIYAEGNVDSWLAVSVRCVREATDEEKEQAAKKSAVAVQPEPNPVEEEPVENYPSVTIGALTWMSKNMDKKVKGSFCYDEDPRYCEKFGRLYTWKAASTVCPKGWDLPSKYDWDELFREVARFGRVGTALKSMDGWENDGGGKDFFGLRVLPSGVRLRGMSAQGIENPYEKIGERGHFWTSTTRGSDKAKFVVFADTSANVMEGVGDRYFGFSVRCVRIATREEREEAAELSDQIADQVAQSVLNSVDGRNSENEDGSARILVDERDGNRYNVMQVGNNTWMQDNLNFATGESFCYNNSSDACRESGRLYTWKAAQNACPNGWRLPSEDEANKMMASLSNFAVDFQARATGFRKDDGSFLFAGVYGYFWTKNGNNTKGRYWYWSAKDNSNKWLWGQKSSALSVRCIR